MQTISIQAGAIRAVAEIDDSDSAERVFMALPVAGPARRWGGMMYVRIPLECRPVDGCADVSAGSVALWPAEQALCVFSEQTQAEGVIVIGRLQGDRNALGAVLHGTEVRVERAERPKVEVMNEPSAKPSSEIL